MMTVTIPPAKPDPTAIRKMFASIARRYDFLNRLLSLRRDQAWRRAAVGASELRGDERVLDVCTGTGDLALEYARRIGDGGIVVGTDFCREMLLVASRKVRRNDRRAPRFAVADTLQLPFRDEAFDVVSVAFGIRNVADIRAGLKEMLRVTAPGGRGIILEFGHPQGPVFGSIYRFYFSRILPRIGRLLARSPIDAYQYLPDSVKTFPSGEALQRIMEEVGWRGVRVTSLTMGIVNLGVGLRGKEPSEERRGPV